MIVRFERKEHVGNLGDQMHHYYRVRRFAEEQGAGFQCQPWVGDKVFKLDPYTEGKPTLILDGTEHFLVKPYDRDQARRWFQLHDRFKYCPYSHPFTCVNLRRGDLMIPGEHAPVFGVLNYKKFCGDNGIDWSKCVIISDDWQYQHYWIDNANKLNGRCEPEFAYMIDFHILTQADTLLIGMSGFSWWVGLLGRGKCYHPSKIENHGGFGFCTFEVYGYDGPPNSALR